MKKLAAVLVTVTCAILGLVATSTAATAPVRPVVLSAHISPSRLGASGGHIEVTGKVQHANWCQLKLLSHVALVVVYSHNPKNCEGGKYSARVLIGTSSQTKDVTLAFALVVGDKTSSSTQRLVLELGEPGRPKTTTTTTTKPKPAAGSTGGTTSTTSTTVATTTTTLPVTTTAPVIILPALPAPTGTTGTTVLQTTTTRPATTTTTAPATTGTSTTTTTSTSTTSTSTTSTSTTSTSTTSTSTSTTTTSTTSTSTTTTTGATTTTTGPTTTTTVPASIPADSSNWSGYAVSGGPYNQIEGTFTVPAITTAATCTEHVAEWVGIDGWNAHGLPPNDSLIQAGVDASMTDPDTGTCTAGKYWVWPWWEILPQDETPISTVNVSVGDQVTVVISQKAGTSWAITLTDDTNDQTFTIDEAYTGPAVSGEWVVEASSTSACAGDVLPGQDTCQLAPFCAGPSGSCGPVPFSGLSSNGAEADWWQVFMVQGNATVATPSVLGGNGFSVAYTGTQAGISGPAGGVGPVPVLASSQPPDQVFRQPVSAG